MNKFVFKRIDPEFAFGSSRFQNERGFVDLKLIDLCWKKKKKKFTLVPI